MAEGNTGPSFNRNTANPEFIDLLNAHKRDTSMSINCHAIGIVESFNPIEQTCSVKINYVRTNLVRDDDGAYVKELIPYPILIDCPTIMLHGGAAGITMPIKKDDSCIVMFNDRDIDNWFSGQNNRPVASNRVHSISDGIVIVGLRSLSNSLENYDADNAVFYNGDTKMTIKSDKFLIENSSFQLGALLRELIDEVKAISTTNAVPGNPSLISPASQLLLEGVAVKIEGLLE